MAFLGARLFRDARLFGDAPLAAPSLRGLASTIMATLDGNLGIPADSSRLCRPAAPRWGEGSSAWVQRPWTQKVAGSNPVAAVKLAERIRGRSKKTKSAKTGVRWSEIRRVWARKARRA